MLRAVLADWGRAGEEVGHRRWGANGAEERCDEGWEEVREERVRGEERDS